MDKLTYARNTINEVDRQMAELFCRRMEAVKDVAAYKQERGLPIFDKVREAAVIENNAGLVSDETLRGYYVDFLKHLMGLSKQYQHSLIDGAQVNGATITLTLEQNGYVIIQERGCIGRASALLDLGRKALIVTDEGVPQAYADCVASQCREATVVRVGQGENSKSLSVLETLLSRMLSLGFTRSDCVVAVGGGVVGDLAGFAASVYMRGIDFYNVPTTVLSQVDSSIGGKTAVNLAGIKNIVGSFYQPKKVLIDADVLSTLPRRQIANGLAEAVKMALTSDRELFELFETEDPEKHMDTIIARSLRIKACVVEQDEKENGLRRILNFGHTIGHGIESFESLNGLYHGECVALGMLPMCSESVRTRLFHVLEKLGLPTCLDFDADKVYEAMLHDKKAKNGKIVVVTVDEVGSCRLIPMEPSELRKRLDVIKAGGENR